MAWGAMTTSRTMTTSRMTATTSLVLGCFPHDHHRRAPQCMALVFPRLTVLLGIIWAALTPTLLPTLALADSCTQDHWTRTVLLGIILAARTPTLLPTLALKLILLPTNP